MGRVAEKCIEAVRWRYHVYLRPHVVVHRNPLRMVKRFVNNRITQKSHAPLAFIYANPDNSGDYASHLGVSRLVGRHGAELFCDRVAVEATARMLRIQESRGDPWRGVFIGGGGLLQGCFDDFWSTLCQLDLPLVLFGLGAAEEDTVRRPTSEALLRAISEKARAIHVRDEYTRQLFLAARVSDVTVGVCPSVNYLNWIAKRMGQSSSHLLHVIHDVDLAMAGIELNKMRARLQECATRLGLVYDETRHKGGMPRRLLRRYARAAVIVSSRLHGCIFGFALNKPLIAVDCDRKTPGFVSTHAPATPILHKGDWQERLTPDLLEARMKNDSRTDLQAAIQANESRMAEILLELNVRSWQHG